MGFDVHKAKGATEMTKLKDTEEVYILPEDFDVDGFMKELNAAHASVKDPTKEDITHLHKIRNLTTGMRFLGYAMMFGGLFIENYWLSVAVLGTSAVLHGVSRCMAWAIIGHHVGHGGYDKHVKQFPGLIEKHCVRGIYAFNWRRMLDWVDWMLPEAWDAEHNKVHHYYLSEKADPDCVERNLAVIRKAPIPHFVKTLIVYVMVVSWKWFYYSSNTFKELVHSNKAFGRTKWLYLNWPKRERTDAPCTSVDIVAKIFVNLFTGRLFDAYYWTVFYVSWLTVLVPVAAWIFAPCAVPLVLAAAGYDVFPRGAAEAAWTLFNVMVLSEIVTNVHSFIDIACNHAGDDMWRFKTSCRPNSPEFYLRCIYASVNFETGNDVVDCFYGWLNYQIEHHMWPDMGMLQYRRVQPLVKDICIKYGIPYIQQNAFHRTTKVINIMTGAESMMRCTAVLPPCKSD